MLPYGLIAFLQIAMVMAVGLGLLVSTLTGSQLIAMLLALIIPEHFTRRLARGEPAEMQLLLEATAPWPPRPAPTRGRSSRTMPGIRPIAWPGPRQDRPSGSRCAAGTTRPPTSSAPGVFLNKGAGLAEL